MKILVVDDDDVTRKLLLEVFEREGYVVTLAASGEQAVQELRSHAFPVVISDIRMLELDGMGVLRAAKRADSRVAVVLMTGFGSMEGAVEAIQEGAFDYISKPFDIDELKAVVQRAVKHWESMVALARGGAPQLRSGPLESRVLVGKSPRIVEVYKTVARAAISSSNVLIIGERGTGKERVARALHENSQRRHGVFFSVNCAGLTAGDGESEVRKWLKASQGGTLFLDDLSELPIGAQIALYRELTSEGGTIGRVVASALPGIEDRVKEGRFREDLYYRLRVITVELPPLRGRIEDLSELVSAFVARFSEKNKKRVSHVSEEAMEMLKQYSWPGNIRELEHSIERAVALSRTPILFAEDFPEVISRDVTSVLPQGASVASNGSLEAVEKAHILKVLQETGFNKSKASDVLGIDRATLYRKAQRYGIDLRGKV